MELIKHSNWHAAEFCYGYEPKQLNEWPSNNRAADLDLQISSLVLSDILQTQFVHYFGRRQVKLRRHYSRDVASSQLRREFRRARTTCPEAPRTPSNTPPVTFRGNTPSIHILYIGIFIYIYI